MSRDRRELCRPGHFHRVKAKRGTLISFEAVLKTGGGACDVFLRAVERSNAEMKENTSAAENCDVAMRNVGVEDDQEKKSQRIRRLQQEHCSRTHCYKPRTLRRLVSSLEDSELFP